MNLLQRLLALLGEVPTMQTRVLVTLVCVLITTLRYNLAGIWVVPIWEPSYEWLGFLAVAAILTWAAC